MAACGVHLSLVVLLALLSLGVCQSLGAFRLPPVTISAGSAPDGACPSDSTLAMARMSSTAGADTAFQNVPCGGPGWVQLFNLDMTNTSQNCPSSWTLYNNPRTCSTAAIGCASVTLPQPTGMYRRVCGRARAYATGSPDGFFHGITETLEGTYLDGISVTYGSSPRQHIFSFPGGNAGAGDVRCPCSPSHNPTDGPVPSFVGNNFFCDTQTNGALFDGLDCVTPCCTFNNPPYFTVTLPAPTSDAVEVRICANQNRANEAVSVDQMEIYVQ